MKTKFTSIVKFKKQSVDNIEIELTNINAQINQTINDIEIVNQNLAELSPPRSGSFAELKSYQELFTAHIFSIDELKSKLESQNMKKNQIKLKLKEAYLEYEKIKHLDDLEKNRILAEIKRKEEEELNEISVMLFNNKR